MVTFNIYYDSWIKRNAIYWKNHSRTWFNNYTNWSLLTNITRWSRSRKVDKEVKRVMFRYHITMKIHTKYTASKIEICEIKSIYTLVRIWTAIFLTNKTKFKSPLTLSLASTKCLDLFSVMQDHLQMDSLYKERMKHLFAAS